MSYGERFIMGRYEDDNLNYFEGNFYGVAFANEHRGYVKTLHVKAPYNWGGSAQDLMYGRAGVKKGSTAGWVSIDREPESGKVMGVRVSYYRAPFGEREKYVINRDGHVKAEKEVYNMHCNGKFVTSFNGICDNTELIFSEIEQILSQLSEGKDAKVDLGLRLLRARRN